MKKTTIVISYEASIAQSISAELSLVDRTTKIFSAISNPDENYQDIMQWRPSSYASIRAVLIEINNSFDIFPDTIVVSSYCTSDSSLSLQNESPGVISSTIDENAAGFIILVRELAMRVLSVKNRLILVNPDPDIFRKKGSFAEAASNGAIHAFCEKLAISSSLNKSPRSGEIISIVDSSPNKNSLYQFITKILDHPVDKKVSPVIRFNGKTGLFGLF